jgi:hypothetical protein
MRSHGVTEGVVLDRLFATLGLAASLSDGERPTLLQVGAMAGLIAVAMTITALAGRSAAPQETAAAA